MFIKEQIGKSDFIKNKNICSLKDVIKRIQREAMHLEKIFGHLMYDKGLVASIYKDLSKLNNKK